MSEIKLKPCPFCGGKAELKQFKSEEYWVLCVESDCNVCAITKRYSSAEKAAEVWNRRVKDDE